MQTALTRWIHELFADDNSQASRVLDSFPAETLAACALLLEVALADRAEETDELDTMQQAMADSFGITPSAFATLLGAARQHLTHSISLYEHTRVLNEHLTHAEKIELIYKMWAVAYADGHLDHYEEHLIRRVADLLYVEHRDFMLAKLDARDAPK